MEGFPTFSRGYNEYADFYDYSHLYRDLPLQQRLSDLIDRKQPGESLVIVDPGAGVGNFGRDLLRFWADPEAEIPPREDMFKDQPGIQSRFEELRAVARKAKEKGVGLRYIGVTDAFESQNLFDKWEVENQGAPSMSSANLPLPSRLANACSGVGCRK